MTIDNFASEDAEAFSGYSERTAQRILRAFARLADVLRIELTGTEYVPPGRALIVTNHTFGWDAIFAMALLRRATGRRVWVLGEHAWWRVPWLRKWAVRVGVVDGNTANVDRLLDADELVLVLPGGLRESLKPASLRYRLLWGDRYGFVRAAVRHAAPMLPMASMGGDDLFELVGNAFERGKRWAKWLNFPIPRPRKLLPRRTRGIFRIGEPVSTILDAEEALTDQAVRRLRREIEGAIHELIEVELADQAGFQPSSSIRP